MTWSVLKRALPSRRNGSGRHPAPARTRRRLGEEGRHPILAVLVARRGVIVVHEAFGVRRPEDTTPT